MKHSDAVKEHVRELFDDLLKITDNKYPFMYDLTRQKDESYHVGINCSYQQKMLASNSDDKNLYKALARGVDSMRTQIIRKSGKTEGFVVLLAPSDAGCFLHFTRSCVSHALFIAPHIAFFLGVAESFAGCEGTMMGATSGDPLLSSVDLTFSPIYSSATTSGTSNCPNWDIALQERFARWQFLVANQSILEEEIATGHGPHSEGAGSFVLLF